MYRHVSAELKGPYGGLNLDTVVFYSGVILMAIDHIHSKGYTYRDLKPENCMIGIYYK
jgi:serine/threonine protein kinase